MNTDTSFITNEGDITLSKRFEDLIKDTRFFDCVVGYFYSTGFYKIYKSLANTEKIRILVGIKTDKGTFEALRYAEEHSLNNEETETGIRTFIDLIKQKKLQIRAYPSGRLHSKLYIMTFAERDRDKGRVITGSSNFTEAGFDDNLEFNVELKSRADYEHALAKFESLWKDSVDVSEKYVETINKRTKRRIFPL